MFLHSTKVNGDEIPRLLRNSELVAYHRFRGSKELRVNHSQFQARGGKYKPDCQSPKQ